MFPIDERELLCVLTEYGLPDAADSSQTRTTLIQEAEHLEGLQQYILLALHQVPPALQGQTLLLLIEKGHNVYI